MSTSAQGESTSGRMYDSKWLAQSWINSATDQDAVKRKRSLLLDETKRETKGMTSLYRERIYTLALDAVKAKDAVHRSAAKELARFPKATAQPYPSVLTGIRKLLRSMGFVLDLDDDGSCEPRIDSTLAKPEYVRQLFAQMEQLPPQVSKEAMEVPSIARQLDALAKHVLRLLFLWHFGHISGQEYVVPPLKLLPLDFVDALRTVDLGTSTSQLRSFAMKLEKFEKLEQLRQHTCRRVTVANYKQLVSDTKTLIEFVQYQGLVYQSELAGKDQSFSSFEEKHWVPKKVSALIDEEDIEKRKYFFTKLQSEEEFQTFLSSQWIDVRPKTEHALFAQGESDPIANSDDIRRQKQPKNSKRQGLWEEDPTYCETTRMVEEKRKRLIRGIDAGVDAAIQIYQRKIKVLLEELGPKTALIQEEADTKLAKLNSTNG